MKPKVSIVMPVYNVEQYLDECMQSVLCQSLHDIEIICMDDGSTDASSKMLDKYASLDSRVKVIHKPNSGYGHSVNLGIEQSSGEYIGIVEPDDYINPMMMESMYGVAVQNRLDMISADYDWFYGCKTERVFRTIKIINDECFYGRVIIPKDERIVLTGNYLNQASLFRREFLLENKIRHNESPGASFQDYGLRCQVLMYAKRIMLLDKPFYYYRQDNAASSIASGGKADCVVEEYRYIYKIMKNGGEKTDWFMPIFCRRKFESYLFTFQRIETGLKRKFLNQISEEFQEMEALGELDQSCFTDSRKEILLHIMKDADSFYDSYMALGYEIRDALKGYEKAVIYGAGVAGKRAYDMMLDEDKKKIKGFAVTFPNENLKIYKGVKIVGIDEYEIEKNDMAVIVGVTDKYRDEILRLLKEKEFPNVILLKSKAVNI